MTVLCFTWYTNYFFLSGHCSNKIRPLPKIWYGAERYSLPRLWTNSIWHGPILGMCFTSLFHNSRTSCGHLQDGPEDRPRRSREPGTEGVWHWRIESGGRIDYAKNSSRAYKCRYIHDRRESVRYDKSHLGKHQHQLRLRTYEVICSLIQVCGYSYNSFSIICRIKSRICSKENSKRGRKLVHLKWRDIGLYLPSHLHACLHLAFFISFLPRLSSSKEKIWSTLLLNALIWIEWNNVCMHIQNNLEGGNRHNYLF